MTIKKKVKKKTLKTCVECGEKFTPYMFKKHLSKHQSQNNYSVQQATSYWDQRKQEELTKITEELRRANSKLQRLQHVVNGYRETLGSAGRLLAALVDVSEIN